MGCLRVFWPCGLLEALIKQNNSLCHLIGIYLDCKHTRTPVAVVVGVCEQGAQLPGQLYPSACTIRLQDRTQGVLAVLGICSVRKSQQCHLENLESHSSTSRVWLAAQGCHTMVDALQHKGWRSRQQYLAPILRVSDCRLPQGICSVQVFLYAVPAVLQCASVQHALEPSTEVPKPPWVQRSAGSLTLAAVLQLSQQALQAICIKQQQQQHNKCCQQQATANSRRQEQDSALQQPGQQYASQQEQLLIDTHLLWQHIASQVAWPNHCRRCNWLHCSSLQCPRRYAAAWLCEKGFMAQHHSSGAARPGAAIDGTALLPGMMQHFLGMIMAGLLVMYRQQLLQCAAGVGNWLQIGVLQPHTSWLMQAHPGGIKLHQELSVLLGTAASSTLQLSAALYRSCWPHLGQLVLLLLAFVAGVGGAATACAVAANLLLVVLCPVPAVYVCTAWLHRLQLRCLAATWQLMRGREKVRRLSERLRMQTAAATEQAAANTTPVTATYHDAVSVEQLIVGVLLFTPVVGLLPTTFAWYVSTCCLQGVLLGLRVCLAALGALLRFRAVGVLLMRVVQPEQFPGQLMVQLLKQQGDRSEGDNTPVMLQPSSSGGQAMQQYSNKESPAVPCYHLCYASIDYLQVVKLCLNSKASYEQGHQQQHGADLHNPSGLALLTTARGLLGGRTWGVKFFAVGNR